MCAVPWWRGAAAPLNGSVRRLEDSFHDKRIRLKELLLGAVLAALNDAAPSLLLIPPTAHGQLPITALGAQLAARGRWA